MVKYILVSIGVGKVKFFWFYGGLQLTKNGLSYIIYCIDYNVSMLN